MVLGVVLRAYSPQPAYRQLYGSKSQYAEMNSYGLGQYACNGRHHRGILSFGYSSASKFVSLCPDFGQPAEA